MQFNYEILDSANDALVQIKLKGNLLERYQAVDYQNDLTALLDNEKNKIALDLSKLEFINSNGLSVLINTLTKVRNKGGEVVIFGASDQLKNLFIMTKLDSVFKSAKDETAAKQMLSI